MIDLKKGTQEGAEKLKEKTKELSVKAAPKIEEIKRGTKESVDKVKKKTASLTRKAKSKIKIKKKNGR